MADKRHQWSREEKVRIVLETFDPAAVTAELCRQHGISPRTLYTWRERYMKAGSDGLAGNTKAMDSELRKMGRENENLKKLVGELTLANDALKKTMTGRTN